MITKPIDEADIPLKDVPAYIGLSGNTLHRKIKDGTAPPSYLVGRRRFFPVKSLREWRQNLIAASQNAQ